MQERILETLKRYLEAEEQSENVLKLPSDTYSKLATYTQGLRRISNTNGDDLSSKLIRKQIGILQGIVGDLLGVRLEKAIKGDNTENLLPEEKYVCGFHLEFKRRHSRFISAILSGQPSFFTMAYKQEMSRRVTVRFAKPVGEIIGFDLKKYGPFKVHDLAVIPSGNAEIMISNGDVSSVYSS